MAAGLGNVQRPGMGGQPMGPGGMGSMFRQSQPGRGMDPYGYNRQAYNMSGLQGGYMRPPVFQGPQIDYSGLNLPHMQPPAGFPGSTGLPGTMAQPLDPLADLRRARFGSNQG